jgi:hypothetical protein
MPCTTGKTLEDYINELPRSCRDEIRGLLKQVRTSEITLSEILDSVSGNCTIIDGIFTSPFTPQFV